jgi:hypothetical protein
MSHVPQHVAEKCERFSDNDMRKNKDLERGSDSIRTQSALEVERRVRWYQHPFHEYLVNGGKRAIEIAHRRWGKDEIALGVTCELAHKRVGSYWHCLPEYAQARKALWTAVNPHTGKRRIDEAFPPAIRARTNEQEMFIELKCGSTWQLIGSDRYDSLVGAGVAGVVFSEWALANPSAWAYIRPMLEENGGWAAFITTPRGRNHAKSMYDMAQKNPNWFAEISTVLDTGALTSAQLAESRSEYIALYGEDLGNAQFEQEYMCSFNAAILGAFYARETLAVRGEGRLRAIGHDPSYPVHTAWDLGVRDSTAIWFFQILPGERLLILGYYVAHGVGVDHYAEIVQARRREKGWRAGTDYVPHDARVTEWGTGRTRVEMMFDHGLKPSVVERTTDADGHQAIRTTLPKCIFDLSTEEAGFAALESYRREWDDEAKTFKASALHDWASHGAKAFQYLSQAWRSVAVPKVEQPKASAMQEMTFEDALKMTPQRRERI